MQLAWTLLENLDPFPTNIMIDEKLELVWKEKGEMRRKSGYSIFIENIQPREGQFVG